MHILGKVGVWLVVVVAIASTVLTAKFIQVRNSWTKKDVALQKAYQTLQPKIADLSEQVTRLEAELFRDRKCLHNRSIHVQQCGAGRRSVNEPSPSWPTTS